MLAPIFVLRVLHDVAQYRSSFTHIEKIMPEMMDLLYMYVSLFFLSITGSGLW